MDFRCRPLGPQDVEAAAAWHYPAPFDAYDPGQDPERLAHMRGGLPWAAVEDEHGLAAFYCDGPEARAERGTYVGDAVDFALFLRPDLAGRGHGPRIAELALTEVAARHPGSRLRVTIAATNVRALRLARRLGFRDAGSFGGFRHGLLPHVVLVR